MARRRPDPSECAEIHRIIMAELVAGVVVPDSVAFLRATIDRLAHQGCDAAILGCTEIPLVIDDTTVSIPTLDSTRLLARAALRHALSA